MLISYCRTNKIWISCILSTNRIHTLANIYMIHKNLSPPQIPWRSTLRCQCTWWYPESSRRGIKNSQDDSLVCRNLENSPGRDVLRIVWETVPGSIPAILATLARLDICGIEACYRGCRRPSVEKDRGEEELYTLERFHWYAGNFVIRTLGGALVACPCFRKSRVKPHTVGSPACPSFHPSRSLEIRGERSPPSPAGGG